LTEAGCDVRFYVNDHPAAHAVLRSRGFPFDIVPLCDPSQDWETEAITRRKIRVWIYDKHRTDRQSTKRVTAQRVPIVMLDDLGSGAIDADLHIAALAYEPGEQVAGRRILRGFDYLVLNPEIALYRRVRQSADSYIVTLGGADTYGVTPKVVGLLARLGRQATVVVGPAFAHDDELAGFAGADFVIKRNVPSLIKELACHDVAVTGGGITPLEANALGLPCIIVANEDFEVPAGRALESMGGAIFAGHHLALDEAAFHRPLAIEAMSRAALDHISLEGTRRVIEAILSL
jgi:spore coat polysaccharide biosynthesis predicted glycosyltransferase SpsG